jgi:hypothetical protein
MDTKEYIKSLQIGNDTLFLILKNQYPLIEYSDETISHLWFLVEKIPALSNPKHIRTFAEISNFFWKGLQFQCIPSVETFQRNYREQVELEKIYAADIFPYRLTDYKIFDVSVMHEPRIDRGHLTFFVYNVQTGLPYRVVCPFPYPVASTRIHYQILPILE